MDMLAADRRPSQIITRKSLENAITSVAATAGSTNGILHLLAIAHEAQVPLTLEDFHAISQRTPVLADLKPGGQFVANDLYEAGGIPFLAKRLAEAGLIHADELTVTGKTIGVEANAATETEGQQVVRPVDVPLKPTGGFAILRGNLAPDGCVNQVGWSGQNPSSGSRTYL